MRKTNFLKKGISLMLAAVMILALAVPMADSKAAETTEDGSYDVAEFRNQGTAYTYPTKNGYVFAGWYTDADYQTPLGTDVKEGKAYAKFVTEDVLRVKCQLPLGASETDTTTAIRLVTSVDSIDYRYVGFQVAYTENGQAKARNFQTKNVYSVIKGSIDGRVTMKYMSGIFSEASSYLMAITINKMPMAIYNSGLTVTAQWVTLDGTTVNGQSRILKEELENGTGTTPLTAGLYVLGEDKFIATGGVGTSVAGKYNEGIQTHHRTGANTVLEGYKFGKKDFTISCWFKTPSKVSSLGTGPNNYLFGIGTPNTANVFSIQLKKSSTSSNATAQLRINNLAGGQTSIKIADYTTYAANTWMHLAAVRSGDTLQVYLDGVCVHTYDFSATEYAGIDLGSAKLALGSYPGMSGNYQDNSTWFDDLRLYSKALAAEEVKALKDSTDGTVSISAEPKALVTYDDGIVANTGTDSTIKACLYKMSAINAADGANYFIDYNSTTGMDGTLGGAAVATYGEGPYTVLKGYDFGANDFSLSTWFKVPASDIDVIDSETYLFGTSHVDATDGFAVYLDALSPRLKVNGVTVIKLPGVICEKGEWNNVVLTCKDNVMKLSFNDKELGSFSLESDCNFGVKDLAFGGYYGNPKYDHPGYTVYYDDIEMTMEGKKAISIADIGSPEVKITYADGTIANTGTDSTLKAGAYKLDQSPNATKFVETTDVTYAIGMEGDANGALSMKHNSGAYTVIKDYNFGTDSFTISTWFNVPAGSLDVSTGSGTYLFGNSQPDEAGTGFSVCLKKDQIRFRVNGSNNTPKITYEKGTWNNLVLSREGDLLELYFNGTRVSTVFISEDTDFGTGDLAFGAYYGNANNYHGNTMYYDNIQVYGNTLAMKQIKRLYELTRAEEADSTVQIGDPQLEITYANGAIANTGTDSTLKVGAYKLDQSPNSTKFVETTDVTYVAGMEGDANGALSMKHNSGAYTVVKDYNFGTNNFTISTWFNVPTDSAAVSTGSGTYLFGNSQPDETGTGFSVCLKSNVARFRVNGSQATPSITYTKGTWNHVVLTRDSSELKLYFNGTCIHTFAISAETDFGTVDLGFGGYFGNPNNYHGNTMYYDNIQMYDQTLTSKQINQLYTNAQ